MHKLKLLMKSLSKEEVLQGQTSLTWDNEECTGFGQDLPDVTLNLNPINVAFQGLLMSAVMMPL